MKLHPTDSGKKRHPKLHSARWHACRHSNRVLVWVEGYKGQFGYAFGCYLARGEWSIEGMSGPIWKVRAWAYLKKNPLK